MTNILDINLVDTYNVESIGFADISTYDPSYTISNATFEITPPGFNKVSVTFTPKQVNIYNASNLNLGVGTGTQLPDGIYTITYSVFPNLTYTVTKSFMRTTLIKCLYKRVFLAMDTKCNCSPLNKTDLRNKLRDIALLIDGSIASASECDIINAEAKYNKAMFLLKNIKLCEC